MAVCATCQKPLVLEIDASDDEDVSMGGSSNAAAPQTVPDDVHLRCNCHFHWDCLLSSYTHDTCPSCSTPLVTTTSSTQQILCTLSNEGGVQHDLDLMPLLLEESYLKAYPEERKARAFLEFCRAGDVGAIVEMVQADDDPDDEDEEEEVAQPKSTSFLRYQDPLADMQSGLHAAVQAGSREVAWLLLLLASRLDLVEFPVQVFQEAEMVGVMRPEEENGEERVDIRSLRDATGRSAEDVAREIGGVWGEWIGKGRLSI